MSYLVSKERMISALEKNGGLITLTARTLGISRQAIHKRIADCDDLREKLQEIRALDLDISEAELRKAIRDGHGWAVKFILQSLGRDRGYVTRSETTGPDGGPVQLDFTNVSDDDLNRFIDALEGE